jgi:HK97 family phage major capsid protein
MGKRYGDLDLACQLVEANTSLSDARTRFLDKLNERSKQSAIASESPVLGFTKQDDKEFSMVRAIKDYCDGSWNQSGFKSFEKECSDEMAKRTGKDSRGILLPLADLTVDRQTLQRSIPNFQSRAPYATNTAASGGNLIQTTLDAANFYDVLRNIPMLFRMGANSLTGLVGNISIPRRTGTSTAYWLSEGQDITESEGTFGQISFTPKTLGCLAYITRLMLLQSTPDIEQLTRMDLLMVMALEIDRVGIFGTGLNNQPRGILNTSGIGNVTGGNSTTATTLAWSHLVDLETTVANLNADFEGNRNYFTNAKGVGTMKKLVSTTGFPLWIGSEDMGLSPGTPGAINGYPVSRSNQVPSNLTKNGGAITNLSAIIYGDFSQLWYAFWGTLEILPNPYGKGYESGTIALRVLQTMDVQIRRVEAFAAITDLITT